jgi:hypothetical protein
MARVYNSSLGSGRNLAMPRATGQASHLTTPLLMHTLSAVNNRAKALVQIFSDG